MPSRASLSRTAGVANEREAWTCGREARGEEDDLLPDTEQRSK